MNDIYEYKELYEQCRSIVLDFTLSCNNNVVVTYANSIPRRISYEEYVNSPLYSATDKCYEAYDGTIITVYNYKNQWYFGTSSCPDANSSKFSHPTKSHGKMFDEVLEQFYSRNPEIVEKCLKYLLMMLANLCALCLCLIWIQSMHMSLY